MLIFHLYLFRGFGSVRDEHELYLVRWSRAIWTARDLTLGLQCSKLFPGLYQASRKKAAIQVIEEGKGNQTLGSGDCCRLDEDGSLEVEVTQRAIMAVSGKLFRLPPAEALSQSS